MKDRIEDSQEEERTAALIKARLAEQEAEERASGGETFDEAFKRWCGFLDGEYHQKRDALGLMVEHDRLHAPRHESVRELDLIADAVADESDANVRRRDLRTKRWARRLMAVRIGRDTPDAELVNAIFARPNRLEEVRRLWGEVCLRAYLSGDADFFQSLTNAAKAYDRKSDRTLAAQVIEIAWDLRCEFNRDPTKEEVKSASDIAGIQVSDWYKLWGNARLDFLPES